MKPVLVDSNVLIDIFTDDKRWFKWSRDTLTYLAQMTSLYINPVIYTEISIGFSRIEEFERCLDILPLKMAQPPKESLFLAGKAFLNYRRNSGTKSSTLPDFFIGAHAALNGWDIATRDPGRVKSYFPTVGLISP